MSEKMSALESMSAVMEKVRGLAKRERNGQQGFNFRGIDAVLNAVGPALREVGAVIVPRVVSVDQRHGQSKNGGPLTGTSVIVEYTWHGPDGSTIAGTAPGEAFDAGDKGTAKAMSVAYRTFLLQTLCLPTDEPDPDAHTYDEPVGAEADRARRDLRALCDQLRLDPEWAKAEFHTRTGEDLATTPRADLIREMTQRIRQEAAKTKENQHVPA